MFFEIFKQLCDANNTNPTSVIKKLGYSTSKITAWKNGSIPNLEIASKIADYFGVTVDYLLSKEQKKITPRIIENNQEPITPEINAIKKEPLSEEKAALLIRQALVNKGFVGIDEPIPDKLVDTIVNFISDNSETLKKLAEL